MGFKEEVPFILRTKTHLGLYDIEKTIEYNTRWGSSQDSAQLFFLKSELVGRRNRPKTVLRKQ